MPLSIIADPDAIIDPKAFSFPGSILYQRAADLYSLRTLPQYPKGFIKLVTPHWRAMTLPQKQQWKTKLAHAQQLPNGRGPTWCEVESAFRQVVFHRLRAHKHLDTSLPEMLPSGTDPKPLNLLPSHARDIRHLIAKLNKQNQPPGQTQMRNCSTQAHKSHSDKALQSSPNIFK